MADDMKLTEYLDQAGIKELTEKILLEVNRRIKNRIVDEIKPDDRTHTPSAAAIYKAIVNKSNYIFTPYEGNIKDIIDPRTDTIYLQRDDEYDSTWTMYVYDITTGWLKLGDPKINLSDYWSKSEEDMELLKEQLGINDMVKEDQLVNIDQETLYTMIADIDSRLSPNMPSYTLTVEYDGPNGKAFASPVVDTYPDGATYYIPSPIISGYTPNIEIVKGVITGNRTIVVTYSLNK